MSTTAPIGVRAARAGTATRVGAGAYVLWGVLHLGLGATMVISGFAGGSGVGAGELGAESTMFFVCAAVLGAQAIAVAVRLNRRNSRAGYWINLLTLGVVDLAFVPSMVVPGHIDLAGGLTGPARVRVGRAASPNGR